MAIITIGNKRMTSGDQMQKEVAKLLAQRPPKVTKVIAQTEVISRLQGLVQEWTEATGKSNLVKVQGSVGLVLFDVAMLLGLSQSEACEALGQEVWDAASDQLKVKVK